MNDDERRGAIREIEALQNIVNETRAQWREAYRFYSGGRLPEPSRAQRFRRRWSLRIFDARTALAMKIAPWLDQY